MQVLLIDNYDSFTYNIEHYLRNYCNINVIRIDDLDLQSIKEYDKIVLSPGPGLPKHRKQLFAIIKKTIEHNKPLLGICLGHQAIAEYFGAELYNLNEVNHGLEKETIVIKETYIYKNIPAKFNSGRYHSWAVKKDSLPKELEISSIDNDNIIMSINHTVLDINGLQYHPESILTKQGKEILENWIKN